MFGSRKKILAVDVGSSAVKVLEFHRDRDDLVVTGFARMDVANDSNRADAIGECIRRGKFGSKRAATSVAGKAVITRFLTMMRMSREELQRAVAFEAEKYIPWPLEESQLDAVSLGDLPSSEPGAQAEMRVLLVAAKRSYVSDHAQMLIDQGLVPLVVDVDALAIATAFELHERVSGSPPPSGAVALVDIGSGKTTINILSGGSSRFVREIDVAGSDMTQAVARRFAMEPFEAERVKCAPGDRAEEVEGAIAAPISDLANELSLSFDYFEHQGDGSVESVHLSGGGSMAPSIAESIERTTGKKAHTWNPIEGLKVQSAGLDVEELNAHAASLAVAVGLAAREF